MCIITVINDVMIIVIYLKLFQLKYVNNYMLIYGKILKSSNHLDILHVNAYIPTLYILQIFLKSNQNCTF